MTTETTNRKPYPSDVSDDEWAVVAPYLTLMTEEAPQREHSLREVFNGLRWIVRTGAQWRMMPHDLPRGRQCISRRSVGSKRACSRRSSMTCGLCCGWRKDAMKRPRRPSLTAVRCKRVRKVGI